MRLTRLSLNNKQNHHLDNIYYLTPAVVHGRLKQNTSTLPACTHAIVLTISANQSYWSALANQYIDSCFENCSHLQVCISPVTN